MKTRVGIKKRKNCKVVFWYANLNIESQCNCGKLYILMRCSCVELVFSWDMCYKCKNTVTFQMFSTTLNYSCTDWNMNRSRSRQSFAECNYYISRLWTNFLWNISYCSGSHRNSQTQYSECDRSRLDGF